MLLTYERLFKYSVIILHDHHQYWGSWRKFIPWKEGGFEAAEKSHGQFCRRTGIWTLQRASQEGTSQLIWRRVAGKEDPESWLLVIRMLEQHQPEFRNMVPKNYRDWRKQETTSRNPTFWSWKGKGGYYNRLLPSIPHVPSFWNF